MVSQTRVEVQQFVADQLGVELDDLVLTEEGDTSYTFRQKSSDQEHTARVTIGPEGPVLLVEEEEG
ncbi:MAG: hypothetical protein WAL70_12155 [Aeromicrobium sp.]